MRTSLRRRESFILPESPSIAMADRVDERLCDYGSSVDESSDEIRGKSDSRTCNAENDAELRSSPTIGNLQNESSIVSPPTDLKLPRQYRRDSQGSLRERSSSRRSKHERISRHDRNPCTRSRGHSRRPHRRRDRSREHRHEHRHRRRRSYSHDSRRRRREYRSSSSSSSSDTRRDRRPIKRERETAFSRKIIGSRSELAKVQEAVKPVDPIAAKLEAANKASAIMASAMKPNESTPQEVLARIQSTQMAQVRAKAEAAAAAANLPSFYNPMSVNAAKLAEQQQKRKLLWSRKSDPANDAKEEAKSTMWKTTSMVAGKGDSAAAAKFRKLMGIHDDGSSNVGVAPSDEALNQAREQADLFRNLEHEFETSRTLTHTQRGAGLGYSSVMTDYRTYAAMKQAGVSDHQEKK